MSTINYIIASIGDMSQRNIRPDEQPPYQDYLKIQLQKIKENWSPSITQVTLCIADSTHTTGTYYNLDEILKDFPCPVVKFHTKNHLQSYGQWLRACEIYKDFDYFIFIEDDYYPACINFADKLVEEYELALKQNSVTSLFLCTLAGEGLDSRPHHACISNGILNKQSLNSVLSNTNLWNDLKSKSRFEIQVNFSLLFDSIQDTATKYKALFWSSSSKELVEFIRNDNATEILFVPCQYIVKDQYGYKEQPG
jgi:hypothetical protein